MAFLRALHATSPDATRRFHDPARRRHRVYLTAGAGVGVIALAVSLYLWGMPALAGIAATRVPVAWEASLGDTVVAHIVPAGKRCEDARRQQAVDTIVSALLRGAPGQPYRFRVTVVDDTAVNALAAPGGALVLYRGLLERTTSADELAGVLAHEIQHVLHRHGTRMLLQRASTALLLAAVAGDVSGVMAFGLEAARTLGDLQFSRQNEEEADHDGLRMLLAAGIDPRGMLEFFRKVATLESTAGTLPRYLSSHPPLRSLERLKALATAPPRRRRCCRLRLGRRQEMWECAAADRLHDEVNGARHGCRRSLPDPASVGAGSPRAAPWPRHDARRAKAALQAV